MARENGDVTMKTVRVLCNFCDGDETTKKASVPCNLCAFSRYEQTPYVQDNGAVSMESELKRLRFLTRRITGRDLDGASFSELESLHSRSRHVYKTVKNIKIQVKQEELERLRNQLKQAANGEMPQKQQDDEAPKPVITQQSAYERRVAEPMESEIERLSLLNERMNGRKLEGMSLYELHILSSQLLDSMQRIADLRFGPITDYKATDYKARQLNLLVEQERCSLDNVKGEDHHCDISIQFRPQPQELEAVSMESEVKRLRLLIKRMTGRDLDGLSFPELQSLESRLKHVVEIVKNLKTQVEQEEDERMQNQNKQAANELGTGRGPLVPCSSGERQQKEDDEAPKPVVNGVQREYERRLAEPMECEFERLWLLNERMNGRKLEGMSGPELLTLEHQITRSLQLIFSQKFEPSDEERAKRLKEESLSILVEQDLLNAEKMYSLHNVKDEDRHRDFSLGFRPRRHTRCFAVSRKLRRFQTRKSWLGIRSALRV